MSALVKLPVQTFENKHRLFKAYVQYLVPILGIPQKGKAVDVLATIMYYIYLNKEIYKLDDNFDFVKLSLDLNKPEVKDEIRELTAHLYDDPTSYKNTIELDFFKNIIVQLRKIGCFREPVFFKDKRKGRTLLLASNLLFNIIYKDFDKLELTISLVAENE